MEAPCGVPKVGGKSQLATRWLILAAAVTCVACTPTVYKPEVERIGSAIGSATDSFKTLVVENSANDIVDRNKGFVADKSRLALGPDCAKIDAYIKAQNVCLVSWSLFRQNPSNAPKPGCVEPVPFAPIPAEMQHCAIGRMQGDRFVNVPLATARGAQNHLRLAEAMAAYAAQLAAIVSADDREQLESAVSDAVAAARSVQAELAVANPGAKSLDVGPIADFIGTGLLLVLEARRFSVLKGVAEKADPVILQASGQLALFANQLYYINTLQPAFAALDNAVLRAVPVPAGTFPDRVDAATAREQFYAAALAVTPGDVFKAVADAHHDLVLALNDPSRQIDALKIAVATLSSKAKALADVLKASKEQSK
ncbi:MAG TPA: hypothetical protein PLW68_14425 [Casimicrobiaceae bacterium]|nr:hypothetical protein [Casimicrobiaceae bacterium]